MIVRVFQKGFNFSQDGPGNRLVYHLQGCNLRCPWCSNPEGLSSCGGTEYTIEEIIDEITRSRMMFFEGGGVTFTGGEVTTQFDSVKELLFGLHKLGIHTCIETNGLSPRLPELFPALDLLIMDIKHFDPNIHKTVTGASNLITMQNITTACNTSQELALRIPLIGGFNASPNDAFGFANLLKDLGVRDGVTIELLPYHEYGKDKYRSLRIEYTMTETAYVSPAQLACFAEILTNAGFKIVRT